MKKLLFLFFLSVFISSCGKKDSDQQTPVPETEKKIDGVLFGPELPIQRINTPFYVGVRYVKNYQTADEVKMTFNGLNGELVDDRTNEETSSGAYHLFKFSAIDHAVEGKIKVSIKNNQKTFEKEIPYKIVPDFELKNVWDYFSKAYMSSFDIQINRYTLKSFSFRAAGAKDDPNVLYFGVYGQDLPNTPGSWPRLFLPNLQGTYKLTYTGDKLTEIFVNAGSDAYISGFHDKIFKELETLFGPYTTVMVGQFPGRSYNYPDFTVTSYVSNGNLVTSIKKK